MRRSALKALVLTLLMGSAGPSGACAFDGLAQDLYAAHPDSLAVAIAISQAYQERRIAQPIALPGGFGLRRVLQTLAKLDAALARQPAQQDFYVLLVESGLWVRYQQQGDRLQVTPHVQQPASDSPTVVTGEGVLLALLQGHLQLDDALADNLLHIQATPAQRTGIAAHWQAALEPRR